MKRGHNFRELKIWKEGISVVKEVYILSSKLPETEKFGLISQINRASVSIPSNIAEGSGRSTEKDFVNFLRMSLSSSYEVETQLIIINELFNIPTDELIAKMNVLQAMIGRFIQSIENQ